jgi:flagellar assembly protein FliH
MAREMEMQHEITSSIQDFQYPSSGLPAPSAWQSIVSICSEPGVSVSGAHGSELAGGTCPRESDRDFEEAKQKGIEEGRHIEQLEQSERIVLLEKHWIEQAAKLCEQIALERDNFLQRVEPEVVKLALRIAERILGREVQVDPLSLTNVVRVALGQLADKASVRVRVPANDAGLWTETFQRVPSLRTRPTIIADKDLQAGECQLESECGFADLGVQTQLRAISRNMLGDAAIESQREAASTSSDAEVDL